MKHKTVAVFIRVLLASAILVTLVTASMSASAADDHLQEILKRGVIKVGTTINAKPYAFRDEQGRPVGLEIDLMTLMAEYMGVKLEIVDMDWEGLIPALRANRIDLIGSRMLATLERAKSVWFTVPWMLEGTSAYTRKDTPFKSWHELNSPNVRVGTISGSVGEELARSRLPKAELVLYKQDGDVTQALLSKRIDAALNGRPICVEQVRAYPEKLRMLPGYLRVDVIAYAVRQGDISLQQWLNLFFHQIRNTGEWAAMYEKWMGEPWSTESEAALW